MSTILEAGPLQGLATELQRQLETKRDIMARTTVVSLAEVEDPRENITPDTAMLVDLDGEVEQFGVTRYAHQQIGEFVDVPWKLYERLLGKHPDLLHGLAEHHGPLPHHPEAPRGAPARRRRRQAAVLGARRHRDGTDS